jgi:hypothetical protein
MNPRHFPDKKNQRWRKRAETLFTSADPSVCYCADAQIGIEVWRVFQLTAVNPRRGAAQMAVTANALLVHM